MSRHTHPSLTEGLRRMGSSPVGSHMNSTLNAYKLCLQRSNQEELGRKACLQNVRQTDPRNVHCLNGNDSRFLQTSSFCEHGATLDPD